VTETAAPVRALDHRRLSYGTKGITAVLLATVVWSFGGVLGKSAHASGIVVTFWRFWIVLALLTIFAAATRRWPSRRDFRLTASAGVLFGLNIVVFFTAIETLSVATALIITALAPVVALPLSKRLYGETVTTVKVLCAVGSVVGVVAAVALAPRVGPTGKAPIAGYLWAVLALAMWVAFLLKAKRIRRDVSTQSFLFVVNIVATLAVSVLVLAVRPKLGDLHGAGWLWTAGLAIGPGIIGHGLVAWAQPRVDTSVASVLMQAEPVGASITAWAFLGERVSLGQGLAMCVVIVALCVLTYSESREAKPSPVATPIA
jgi:drug/metabolite transporter (DMT)-like permease